MPKPRRKLRAVAADLPDPLAAGNGKRNGQMHRPPPGLAVEVIHDPEDGGLCRGCLWWAATWAAELRAGTFPPGMRFRIGATEVEIVSVAAQEGGTIEKKKNEPQPIGMTVCIDTERT